MVVSCRATPVAKGWRRGRRCAGLLFGALLGASSLGAASSARIEELLAEIRVSELASASAVQVDGISLGLGSAMLKIRRGVLVPTTPIDGRVVELVFLGDGLVELVAPNEVEAHQIEVFTGSRQISEPVSQAVLVVASDAASGAILARPKAAALEAAERQAATELLASWRASAERRLLNVEGALLADAFSDAEGYFAGWFEGQNFGRFLYLFEPWASEPVTLGRFVPFELDDKVKKRLDRLVRKVQRRGRLIGFSTADLGQWDTWVSAAPSEAGNASFEPEHYELDVAVDPKAGVLRGAAKVRLRSPGVGRVVRFDLLPHLTVDRVADGNGAELPFYRAGGELWVFLERSPALEEPIELLLAFSGRAFEEVDVGSRETRFLIDTLLWYPHAGLQDLASYDVTLRWPKRLELLSGGETVAEGEEGGERWRRLRVPQRTKGFTFEVGKFKILEHQAGHVRVRLAVDAASKAILQGDDVVLGWIVETLEFLEATFGPLPIDELVVVTSPRDFSQAMLGFVTLSTVMMVDDALFALFGHEDPRTVIAHELSHQWWGHQVSWASYRDQWMSEALANYSAALFSRRELAHRAELWAGPTSGWKEELRARAASGHPVEALGPVVLGARLSSSLSPEAYQAVVYKKGALVLNLLARSLGEENFLKILRWMAEQASFRIVSTEVFLEILSQGSGLDLDPLFEQFVYGTGIPTLTYTYSAEPAANGKWRVSGTVEQRTPFTYRYRLKRDGSGRLDVVRERVDLPLSSEVPIVVPFELALFDPDRVPGTGKKKGRRQREIDRLGNVIAWGRLRIEGASSPFDLEVDFEPRKLTLDPEEEVLVLVSDDSQEVKGTLLRRGQRAAAEGRGEEARRLFLAGLETGGAEGEEEATLAAQDRSLHLGLARIALDQGRDDEADTHLRGARESLRRAESWQRPFLETGVETLECRLALRRGEAKTVVKRLRPRLDQGPGGSDVEAMLLLALAARRLGDRELEAEATEAVQDRHMEVADLAELSP